LSEAGSACPNTITPCRMAMAEARRNLADFARQVIARY
jgi:hypothetical protein